MKRTTRFLFPLLAAILIGGLIGCGPKKGTDSTAEPTDGEATASSASAGPSAGPVENASSPSPPPAVEKIRSLTPERLAALGKENDWATEWIFPNAFFARVIQPTRFLKAPQAADLVRFFQNYPTLIPFCDQLDEIELMTISDKFASVTLTDPQTGQTLGERYPLPVKATYLKKTAPIDRVKFDGFIFSGVPQDQVKELKVGEYSVKTTEQSIRVPIDETGRNAAKIDGVLLAVYYPTDSSVVIVHGPKAEIEEFFSGKTGEERGILAQRIKRLSPETVDFAFLYDFTSPMKQFITLPVNRELAEALFYNAENVLLTIDANSSDASPALTLAIDANSPKGADAVESTLGASLIQLGQQAQQPPKLPEGTQAPEEMVKYLAQVGNLVKTITMKKEGISVVSTLNRSPELIALVTDAVGYLNATLENSAKAMKNETIAQKLTVLGRLMNNVYYGKFNAFPPMSIRSADGRPLLGWRVALLAALGPDGEALYKQFKLDQPWDGPDNIKLLDKMPDFYQSPYLSAESRKTTFQIVTSPGTPFGQGKEKLTVQDIPNPGKTFLIVSTAPEKAIEWTRPDELAFDPAAPEKSGEIFGDVVLAVPVMGEVFHSPYGGKPEEAKAVGDWILGQSSDKEEEDTPSAEPTPAPETPAIPENTAPAEEKSAPLPSSPPAPQPAP